MIKDLDELQKLLKLCRKQGVQDIKLGDCHITFGELPRKQAASTESDDPETEELTPEQMMFFSVGGAPP